ncbi:MAG: FecR domain-containing protein [Chloroflexota bacterium]|nr:FecR family protein [Dehalococcoidia bacterium]MDW8254692.1 FecR domain-containing protein [Chloroflexota bacterium]
MATLERPRLRQHSDRLAWLIIWVAFGLFCLLCIGSVLSLRWYQESATQPYDALLGTVIGGTITRQSAGSTSWVVVNEDAILREHDRIQTDRVGRALVSLFDGSTVLILPESEIQLSRLQVSVFAPKTNYVSVRVNRGKAVIAVARPPEGRTEFTLLIPQGRAVLLEGSYSVVVGEPESEIKVRERGHAFVTAGGRTVELRERFATSVGRMPSDPRPAATDLIRNGTFTEGFTGWQREPDQTYCLENTPAPAQVQLTTDAAGQPAVRFVRTGSQATACEVFLRQEINRDVSEFWTLRLSVEINVISQSLGGGGSLGSEYPMMIRLRYRSAEGLENLVVQGFYVENPTRSRVDYGVPVRAGVWETIGYEQDLMSRVPTPRQILYLEVVAGGHDYESYIRRVSLVGE